MVKGGDPTYYADPGQSIEDAAAACIERRLVFFSGDGRRRVAVGVDDAAALAQRWKAFATAPAGGSSGT